jgi:hypothetical protein
MRDVIGVAQYPQDQSGCADRPDGLLPLDRGRGFTSLDHSARIPPAPQTIVLGKTLAEANQELFIFKKGDDGNWCMARYSFSPTNPPAK